MAKGLVFHVGPQQAQSTLAAALRVWLPDHSWNKIRRLIRGRRVLVSGNVCLEESRRLRRKDVVKVLDRPVPRPPSDEDIRVEFFDAHVCVIHKPPGINSTRHPDEWQAKRVQFQPSVHELLPRILKRIDPRLKRHRGWPPVFAVHRLDRDTGGLMVFARTHAAQRHLMAQFKAHTIQRVYWAIVYGHAENTTIDTYLVRDRGDGRRGSSQQAGMGRRAVTHVRVIEHIGPYSVVECRLETGRTHQIRIHLSEIGHRVCGESIYNKPLRGPVLAETSGAPRLALHAAELGFHHPVSGRFLAFRADWPDDLRRFLRSLRRRHGCPDAHRPPEVS
ncbi:MAG: pseudouridine synthase [Pirellulaceae bacterium]|nr:MAG: pseudouridine synthase [Pirellulaceae bacterium]